LCDGGGVWGGGRWGGGGGRRRNGARKGGRGDEETKCAIDSSLSCRGTWQCAPSDCLDLLLCSRSPGGGLPSAPTSQLCIGRRRKRRRGSVSAITPSASSASLR